MFLRGGSKFELFHRNEKGTIRQLLPARCPLFFLFSFYLHLLICFRSCFPDSGPLLGKEVFVLCSFVLQSEVDKTDYLSIFWGHLLIPRTQPGYEDATFAHTYSGKHQTFQPDATRRLKQLSFHAFQSKRAKLPMLLCSRVNCLCISHPEKLTFLDIQCRCVELNFQYHYIFMQTKLLKFPFTRKSPVHKNQLALQKTGHSQQLFLHILVFFRLKLKFEIQFQ